jgi:hypothetical protein
MEMMDMRIASEPKAFNTGIAWAFMKPALAIVGFAGLLIAG